MDAEVVLSTWHVNLKCLLSFKTLFLNEKRASQDAGRMSIIGTCGAGNKGQIVLVEDSESRNPRAHCVPKHHFPCTSGEHQNHTEVVWSSWW